MPSYIDPHTGTRITYFDHVVPEDEINEYLDAAFEGLGHPDSRERDAKMRAWFDRWLPKED